MKTKEEIKQFYNRVYASGEYSPDAKIHGETLPWYWQFLQFVRPLSNNDMVLEIGCGEGKLMYLVSNHVKEVYGIDISNVAIEQAEELLVGKDNRFLSVADNLSQFQDEFFDLIFEVTVFQHMLKEHIQGYLTQSFAKLKKGGFGFFQLNNDPYLAFGELEETDRENRSSWTKEEFSEALVGVGFTIKSFNIHDMSYLTGTNKALASFYVVVQK